MIKHHNQMLKANSLKKIMDGLVVNKSKIQTVKG